MFNGEIYNYLELREELAREHGATFATEGDTEAIVAAYHHWGPAAVARLRGMFAFLIWDAQERVLFGARDPFGIKPLFFATGPAGVAFGSEKKSLLELTGVLGLPEGTVGSLDEPALQHYLILQYVPEPATLHRSVRRIESGCTFTVRPGGEVEQERYFTPRFTETGPTGRAAATAVAEVLRDSVAKHMRADVTVGAFLSGGIDSTAIAALAKEHNPDLITFTTGFEREGYSRGRRRRRVGRRDRGPARHPHGQAGRDDGGAAADRLVPRRPGGRPRAGAAVVHRPRGPPARQGRAVRGGRRRAVRRLHDLPGAAVAGAVREGARARCAGCSARRRGTCRRACAARTCCAAAPLPLEQRYYGNARIFRDDQLRGVLRRYDPRRGHIDITAAHYAESVGWDPVARMQHVDLFTWLRGDILVKADKMTMANSLELRVPFLDPEVFAVASTLPRSEKVAEGTTKLALRRALDGIVPPHVLHRRKLGFPVPIRHWLRDEMYDWARGIVRDSQADHLVDLAAVQRLLDAHRAGPVDHSRRIWTLLVFLLWHGIFVEGRLRPEVPEPAYPVML